MAEASEDKYRKLREEFDVLVNSIQISEPRYKSLERIVEWGFAVSIGTILGVISNYNKFKINEPRFNAYTLILILFFFGNSFGITTLL